MKLFQHDIATMFRGRAERNGVQNSNTPGLLHGDFAGQERLWSKIPEVTNADVADVALLSRMEAGARLNAALPPESKEILHSLRTLVAAPVRRSNTLGQPGRQSVTMQASGTLAWWVRKGFGMVLVVSVIGGLLLLAYCVSRVKATREAKKKSVQTLFDTK